MKFERTRKFDAGLKRLSGEHQRLFYAAAPRFHAAAVSAAAGKVNPWPAGMRVKKVQGASGVWEMTWSMDNPDGRATWEWTEIDGEPAVRWRRIGTHRIFTDP